MTTQTENTKRIAKNTVMLYVRMLFSMLVSLYTSRVVLNVLGVEDYGIYNVVGGFVAMLAFLNTSMSGATSRFLTFELGKNDVKGVSEAFSSALIIHIGAALVVLVAAETLGLWIVETQLVIPVERMPAVRIVYQLSVLSTIIGFTQVPYDAAIIAHEKMDVYAYIGILNVCLKLAIVYMLLVGNFDKLILYAVLSFIVSVLIMMIYRGYCVRHYEETHFRFIWKPATLKPMLLFSTYDLYGNLSVMMRTQGVNMLLNIFFGPVMNAAAAIATQVQGAVMSFANNVITAVRPQIIKQYANKEYESMLGLLSRSIRFNSVLLACLSVPLMVEIGFILKLWLGQVPEKTAIFCFYVLLFNFFVNMSILLVSAIHATGNIKRPSFINGTLYLLVVPFSYVAFKMGLDSWTAYLLNVLAVVLGLLSNAWTIQLYIKEFSFRKFVFGDFARSIIVVVLTFIAAWLVHRMLPEGWLRLGLVAITSCIIILVLACCLLFSASERAWILNFIKSKICRAAW